VPLRTGVRGYELAKYFSFATAQPSLNPRQMMPFYAFVGKLHTLSKSVAAGIHRPLCHALPALQNAYIEGGKTWSAGHEGGG
jgi:hypothetical protein